MPTVTAAITTHNRAEYVAAAVESVLEQTYRDHELVVIDNGSTDETEQALEPYRDRIRYVYQENRGRAGSRNRAIEEAKGRYIAFLDSDDEWLPNKLERQVPILVARPHAVLVHGQVALMNDEGRPLPVETEEHQRFYAAVNRDASYSALALQSACLTSTAVFRADTLRRVGGYDTEVALEDLDLYLRLALEGELVFLDGEPVARYRFHGSQTSHDDLTHGQIQVCRKHLSILDERPVPNARQARRNLYLTLARSHYILAELGLARRYAVKAVGVDPRALLVKGVARRLALSLLPASALRRWRRARQRPEPVTR